jgi:glyoxylase-like metal-dependent hydrolase (beta-lactamase superfamily II)
MAIYQLPTGTYETRAAFAVRGGSFRDKRQFAATAVLVEHPAGDLLVDAGFGARVAEHVAMLPRFTRAPFQAARTASEQLDDSGYDRSRLRGVVLTHSHWDHAGGLDSLELPVWMNRRELDYAATDGDGKVYRSVAAGHEVHEYSFDGPPYLGFPASFDVHGDGSVGDLTWQLEGITRRVERPWLLRTLADSDAGGVREGILRAAALTEVMQVVPAHARDAYEGIPLRPGAGVPR